MHTDSPEDMLLLSNQLCFALYAASRKIIGLYAPLMEKLGITYTQYLVLLVLWEHRALSVKEIGDRLLLDSGTLTPVLKKLQDKGYVTRKRSGEDERVVIVEITDAGVKAKEEALAFLPGMVCAMGVAPERLSLLREELRELLEKLP